MWRNWERLPPVTIMIMTECLQENNDECNQWFDQTKLQCGLFTKPQKSNRIRLAYNYIKSKYIYTEEMCTNKVIWIQWAGIQKIFVENKKQPVALVPALAHCNSWIKFVFFVPKLKCIPAKQHVPYKHDDFIGFPRISDIMFPSPPKYS